MAKNNKSEFRKFCEEEMVGHMGAYDGTDVINCAVQLYDKFIKLQNKKSNDSSVLSLKPNKKLSDKHGAVVMTEKEASLTPQDIKKKRGKKNAE